MVTDKLSERAAQLARIIAESGTPSNRLPNVIMDRYKAGETVEELAEDYGIDEEQIEWGIRIAHLLEQANLARGLALEQAAQHIQKLADKVGGLESKPAMKLLTIEIRSLDPDAAQALAAHDKPLLKEIEELKKWKESAISVMPPFQEIAKEIGVKLGDSIHDKILPYIRQSKHHDAEIERRARLDEAKWWQKRHSMHHNEGADYSQCGCEDCQRIAALAESQPAPAKEGVK